MRVHDDPLGFTNASFRAVNQVTCSYRTNTEAAAALLPTELEIDENPKISVMFLSYGFTSVGPFREYIHIIHARFRDEDVGFVPHIFISNERGMLAGREREGYPKLLGDIEFDMNQPNVYGLITARLSRPTGFVLAQGLFRPSEFLGEITEGKPTVIRTLGLRVVGSAVHGGPLSLCEFVPSALEFIGGENLSGERPLLFLSTSEVHALYPLPIFFNREAPALLNTSFPFSRSPT